ncbi:MAG: hypothetical protein AAGD38_17790 [Acidobacteriota bacterium]
MHHDEEAAYDFAALFDESVKRASFEPPRDYRFEPELTGPPPRPIPDAVVEGLWSRRQRLTRQALAVSAVISFVLYSFPAVRDLGVYFLPIAYLDWLAYGLAGLAVVSWVRQSLGHTPIRYIRDGETSIGRVRALVKQPTVVHNSTPGEFQFAATVDVIHPETGEHQLFDTTSSSFSADRKDRYDTSFRVGDYVTMVHLPGKVDKTLRLYGFLDLMPGVGLVRRGKPVTFVDVVLTALGITAVIGFFVWPLVAVYRFLPIVVSMEALTVPPVWTAVIAGAILIGGGFLSYLVWHYRREQRRLESNLEAFATGRAVESSAAFFAQTGVWNRAFQALLVVGIPFIGGLIGFTAVITANAMLDESMPEHTPVEVLGVFEETSKFVFREYYVEYRFADDPAAKVHSFHTHPADVVRFMSESPASAVVRAGFFDLPWIERLEPESPDPSP